MKTKTKTQNSSKAEKLVEYLESNGGSDVFRFGDGPVGIADARKFAEQMRANLNGVIEVEIVQSYNRVTISLVAAGALSG